MSGIAPEEDEETYNMQCFPLYSLLQATSGTTVNYLSLDIEGAEFLVRQYSNQDPPQGPGSQGWPSHSGSRNMDAPFVTFFL